MQDWKEVVGFLCRWCLLLLAGATVVVAAWAGILASASVAADLGTAMIVADAIWDRTESAYLLGIVSPALPGCHPEVAMSGSADSQLLLVPMSGKKLYPRPGVCRLGVNPVRTIGVPYCGHGLDRVDAVLVVIPPQRQVCLVDAAMVLKADSNDPAGFAACLRELQHRYDVAFLHNGPFEDLPHVRRQLRRCYPQIPVILAVDGHRGPRTSFHAAYTLKRHGRNDRRPIVVTEDPGLAHLAARSRFTMHLIASARAGGKGLLAHESFAKFKEYLNAEPIRH